jgi:hypothetical protein
MLGSWVMCEVDVQVVNARVCSVCARSSLGLASEFGQATAKEPHGHDVAFDCQCT